MSTLVSEIAILFFLIAFSLAIIHYFIWTSVPLLFILTLKGLGLRSGGGEGGWSKVAGEDEEEEERRSEERRRRMGEWRTDSERRRRECETRCRRKRLRRQAFGGESNVGK